MRRKYEKEIWGREPVTFEGIYGKVRISEGRFLSKIKIKDLKDKIQEHEDGLRKEKALEK